MKNPNAPRRVYCRKNVLHVCYNGRFYGSNADKSELTVDHPITVSPLPSDGGKARVQVTQKRKGKPTLVETWRTVQIGV